MLPWREVSRLRGVDPHEGERRPRPAGRPPEAAEGAGLAEQALLQGSPPGQGAGGQQHTGEARERKASMRLVSDLCNFLPLQIP